MTTTTVVLRARLLAVLSAAAVGGAATAALTGPPAAAAPDSCAASSIAKTVGKVASDTGDYLDSHPETNQAMTDVQQQSGSQAGAALKTYFDANPKAATDIQELTKPLQEVSTRCKVPLSLPQMLGLMEAAQGGLPGGTGTQTVIGTPGPGAVAVPRPGPAPAGVAPNTAR